MDSTTATRDQRSTSISSTGSGSSPRRGSTGLFASLAEQKRPAQNQDIHNRRQSLHEQRPAPGIIGQMWHNWTQGPAKK